jgi:hypothetical protein
MDLLREFNKKYLGQSDYDPAAASSVSCSTTNT